MKKNKEIKKFTKLKNLEAGTPFIFASGESCFRNMVLLYSSDVRCVVEGFRYEGKNENGEDIWAQFKDNCAPDAYVFVDSTRKKLNIVQNEFGSCLKNKQKKYNQNNNQIKKGEKMNNNEENQNNANNTVEKVKAKRGRKPGLPKIAFPKDREFTAPELIQELGLKPYIVSNELNKALREGRIEVSNRRPSGKGRGRHCKVFKIKQ